MKRQVFMKSMGAASLPSCLACLALAATFAAQAGGKPRRQFLFDLGRSNSIVRPGWTQVTEQTVYTKESGFGWERPAAASFDDPLDVRESFKPTHPHWAGPVHNDVLRDGVEDARPLVFLADVPSGRYLLSTTLGRYTKPRHDLNVTCNGVILATNVDAWGHVWGSQGGVPTRTVAAVVDVTNGHVRLEFDCAAVQPDRWKEYSEREPQGGQWWFLGENKNSVLGIRLLPWVPPRLRLEPLAMTEPSRPGRYDRLIGSLRTGVLRDAMTAFNSGQTTQAIAVAESFQPRSIEESIELGSLLDGLAGSMSVEDREVELRLVRRTEETWRGILRSLEANHGPAGGDTRPNDDRARDDILCLAQWRAEAAQRQRMSLEHVGLLAYGWAYRKTGLRSYDRYWNAYDFAGFLTPEDPLHWKGRLLRGRMARWCWAEGHYRNARELSDREFAALKSAYPSHPLVRLYTGERVPSRFAYTCPAPNAPEWARLQHEALARYLDLIHYWVERRQADNGELGGGWGDDVEILRGWLPAVLAIDDPIARRGLRRLADGIWNSGEITNGFSREVQDVEHGAEPVSDTQPLMGLVDYGDPRYLERCLETMACMRDVWTATNAHGHRHFRSHHFSATEVATRPPKDADVALNGRAANPGLMPLWYARHPGVEQLLGEWVRAWIEDAFRTNQGKPAGFVPGSIRFEDDRFGGHAERWWETRDYFADFETPDYTATLYNHMAGLFGVSGDGFWMRSLHATTAAAQTQHTHPQNTTTKGTAPWAAQVSDADSLAEVMGKWRLLAGQTDHDPFLARRGSPYQRYLLGGGLEALTTDLRQIIAALSANIEISTSEVLFTDRVSLPGNEVLFEMMTGSLGVATYWPMHAVTWEDTGGNVAILVEHASATELGVQLFSFADGPRNIRARLWRLAPGQYAQRLGHGDRDPFETRLVVHERGQSLHLTLPPRQLARLDLRQLEPAPAPPRFQPDLALSADAIAFDGPVRVGQPVTLRLTVHNIGSAVAPATEGELFAGAERVTTVRWPALEAPLDFRARHATAEATWIPRRSGPQDLTLVVRERQGLYSGNNRWNLRVASQ